MARWRPKHLCASVDKAAEHLGQVSWLKKLTFLSQWRDRAGFAPASLFSPSNGAPKC